MTAYFADECRSGLITTTTGAFSLAANTDFLNPSNIMKMSLAVTNLMEGVNVVTAYCDFTALIDSVTEIFNFGNISTDWTQYVVLGARTGGFMIHDCWVQVDCIKEAWSAETGFDAGQCTANIVSSLLDTLL